MLVLVPTPRDTNRKLTKMGLPVYQGCLELVRVGKADDDCRRGQVRHAAVADFCTAAQPDPFRLTRDEPQSSHKPKPSPQSSHTRAPHSQAISLIRVFSGGRLVTVQQQTTTTAKLARSSEGGPVITKSANIQSMHFY